MRDAWWSNGDVSLLSTQLVDRGGRWRGILTEFRVFLFSAHHRSLSSVAKHNTEDQDDPGNAADRGQWVKCLPPVLAVLGQARGKGEELYPNLQNLYNKLRALHESQSTHLYIDIGLDGGCENGEGDSIEDTCMVNVLSGALLGIGTFENDNVQKKFLQDMIKTTDRYIKFLMNNKVRYMM